MKLGFYPGRLSGPKACACYHQTRMPPLEIIHSPMNRNIAVQILWIVYQQDPCTYFSQHKTEKVAPSVQLFQQCRGHTELTIKCPNWSSIYPSSPGFLLLYLYFIVKKLNHRMLSHSTGNNNHKETSMGLGIRRLHMQWERVESLEQTFLYHGLKTENCFSFVYLFRVQKRDMYNQGRQKRYQKKSVSTTLKMKWKLKVKPFCK